jgi:hypothetical protein
VALDFYDVPLLVPVLKRKLELFQFWLHTRMELGIQFWVWFFKRISNSTLDLGSENKIWTIA